ncbi:MAG: AAA family ATPase [Candidatus Aenigmatarchaeota archaeon]
MKPFHTIAVPHNDILEGRLTMDVFAADLWEVFNKRGPDEYKDAETFFKKTFVTKGLDNLYDVVEKRIKGKGGDAVIQLQTPFGGGKTHALIGLYHKSKEWKSNVFVFVGDKLSPSDTIIWEELERQLTGKVKELKGRIVPSGEKIRQILKSKQPVILLIDELIEYLIPARGIKVGESTFDSQILSFIKRLADEVSSLDKCILIVTSPSRTQYSEEDQHLLNMLSERLGRVEKSYAPVEEDEISSIIRKRLFSQIDENEVKKIVSDVVDYFRRENILPTNIEPSDYKIKFEKSYPFLPEVIECFYHRWGSFTTFQRTRGILRLLSLVLYNLKNQKISYISLADFNLKDSEIRRELLKHIGNEFDSVISADITDKNSGSKNVDNSLGSSYKGLQLGTRCSTTIFLYSFSGGIEKGTNINEIKRSASYLNIPSSVVSEAVDMLKERLFYIQSHAGKIFFTNQPNINRILLNKIENIEDKIVEEWEFEYIKNCIKEGRFKTYLWPKDSSDIPDDTNLKLVILDRNNKTFIKDVIENKGNSKRVNRNTIFFLAPIESKKQELQNSIKRRIAFEDLQIDGSLKLSEEQKREIKSSIKKEEENIKLKIREVYRIIYIPQKDKLEELDLGIPTYGFEINLSAEVFEKLKLEGIIIEKIAPIVLKERYLKGKKYVFTKNIYENSLKTLGEDRILSKLSLEESIKEGVIQGIFGLGELKDGKIIPVYWKNHPTVGLIENEILIDNAICEKEFEIKSKDISLEEDTVKTETKIDIISKKESISRLELPLIKIPKGKVSQILGLLNYIQSKFDDVKIKITAEEGFIEKEDYENKIKETLKQLGINIED